jgi:uncharacterized protein YdaU (DUF1376 family)
MAKDPAFLFYPADWLGGTMLMTRHHMGAYMDLLMAQFNNGHMSLKQVKIILGKEDENLWEEVLKSKFVQDPDGNFYNKKLDDEILKRRAFKESRLKNLSSHKDSHMGGHMVNENEDVNNNSKKREELSKEREGRDETFRNKVYAYSQLYPNDMLIKFADYWTEPNKSGTKMRFEQEKTWDLTRRLARWAGNVKEIDHKEDPKQMRVITYNELVRKFEQLGNVVYDQWKPVQFPDKLKPLWVHIDDIKKFNLEILKK